VEIENEIENGDEDSEIPELIELPLSDVLDLHPFQPKEVPDLVREYLDAAYEAGFRRLRIIHGKGIGVQRDIVRKILAKDPRVSGFGDAPLEAGSWGATWIEFGIEFGIEHS
jgi:dsDNA-specific endonuclease/ATPase MutS2